MTSSDERRESPSHLLVAYLLVAILIFHFIDEWVVRMIVNPFEGADAALAVE